MIFEYIDRIKEIDKQIKEEKTGTPKNFAQKLEMSRSHLYNHLKMMEECGAEIKFDRIKTTFCYVKPFELNSLLYNLANLAN